MTENPEDLASQAQPEIQPPSEAEFQVLSALWQHDSAIGLGDICQTIGERYSQAGMPPPATTTVSTYITRLMNKGLVRARSQAGPPTPGSVRLLSRAPRTKPKTSLYETTCRPSDLIAGTFDTLVHAYPPAHRGTRPLLDLIGVMELPPERVAALQCVLQHGGDTASLLARLAELLPLDPVRRQAVLAAVAETPAKTSPPAGRSRRP